jgi:hypothetical protein
VVIYDDFEAESDISLWFNVKLTLDTKQVAFGLLGMAKWSIYNIKNYYIYNKR